MAARTYPSFLIYFDSANEYRWRLQAENHLTIADSGEGYNNYEDCRHAITLIQSPHKVWRTELLPVSRTPS